MNLFHPKNVETAQMEALYHKIGIMLIPRDWFYVQSLCGVHIPTNSFPGRPLDSIPVIHIAGTNGKV